MKDYLKELCAKEKIKLIYTENKITILSFTLNQNTPVIRAHKIFKKCPENISQAIINYYTFKGNGTDNLKLISEYILGLNQFKTYKIIPKDENLRKLFRDKSDIKQNVKTSPAYEANISKVTQKSFWGNASFETKDNSIKVSEDDVMEVDIVISPFDT